MAERKKATAKEETKGLAPELVAAIEEMNNLLGLEPAIATEGDEATILAKVKEGASLIQNEDEKDMTPETWSFLKDGGYIDHLKPAEKAPAGEKPKRVPPTPPKRYTRLESLVDAIKTGETDPAKIVTTADELFVKQGGKSGVELAKADFDWAKKFLIGLGLATEADGKFTMK